MIINFIQTRLLLDSPTKAKRVLYNMLYFGCVVGVYNVARLIKDAIVLYDIGGSDVIYTIKGFGTLLFAIITLNSITRGLSKNTYRTVFWRYSLGCAVGFLLYAFVIRPYHVFLQPSPATIASISLWLVGHLNFGFLKIGTILAQFFKIFIGYWTGVFIYMLCELYGSIHLSFFFWTYMTNNYTASDASKVFPTCIFMSAVMGLLSSLFLNRLNSFLKIIFGIHAFEVMVKGFAIIALFVILLQFYAYDKCMQLVLLEGEINVKESEEALMKRRTSKQGKEMGLLEACRYVLANRYIRNILVLVLGYGLCMGLFEGQYKNQLAIIGRISGSGSSIISVQSYISITQYFIQMLTTFLFYGVLRTQWLLPALITPLNMLILIGLYFAISSIGGITKIALFLVQHTPFIREQYYQLLSDAGQVNIALPLVQVAVPLIVIGSIGSIFIKLCKYVFFDNTKERAFNVLRPEERTAGKAVVDLLGSRLGKGLSGQIFILFLLPYFGGSIVLPSYQRVYSCATPTGFIVIAMMLYMIYTVIDLARLYQQKLTDANKNYNNKEDKYQQATIQQNNTDTDLSNNKQKLENTDQEQNDDYESEDDVLESIVENSNTSSQR